MALDWDEELRLYIDIGDDGEEDEIIPLAVLIVIRDLYASGMQQEAREIADLLLDGDITVQEFVLGMRELIAEVFTAQYLFGIGGPEMMTDGDWARLEQMILKQYGFLQSFGIRISQGMMTPGEISANAALYMAASVQAFEIGRAEGAFEIPRLPAYPGDGSSICKANDKCFWLIVEEVDVWLAFWIRTVADSCDTCVEREQIWNPLVINK